MYLCYNSILEIFYLINFRFMKWYIIGFILFGYFYLIFLEFWLKLMFVDLKVLDNIVYDDDSYYIKSFIWRK